jgi:ankyrin repeat protein
VHGDAKLVFALLERKANLETKLGVSANNTRVGNYTPLIVAAEAKHSSLCVRLVVEAKSNPNAVGDEGNTALMDAVDYCGVPLCKALLNAKADLHAVSCDVYGNCVL